MPFCSFSEGSAMFDVTPIENMFLLEYLPTAPDGFLRVYLYARMLCLHPELGGEIGDMARALRMDEDAVFNAFSYWERQGLVERLSDRPISYAIRPLKTGAGMGEMDRDYYEYREFNSAMQNLFGSEHLLQPNQYKMANDWLNVLGLTQDAALKLLEYEYEHGSRQPSAVFKRADKRAAEWADRGIRTLADAQRAIAYDDRIYSMAQAVMKQFSLNRKPGLQELECVRRWIHEWKLSEADVLAACEKTINARSPSFGYLDAILRSRMEGGSEDANYDAVKDILRELGSGAKVPTPQQIRLYGEWLEQGFEPGALRLAAVRCAGKNWHSFDKLEEMIAEWQGAGVRSLSQAEDYLAAKKQAYMEALRLMQTAGLSRRPGMEDIRRYEEWKEKYAPDLLLYAAECAAGKGKPMPYMEKLLSEWSKQGISTVEAARADHARVSTAARPGDKPQAGPVNFTQRSYTAEELSNVFYDPMKDFQKEGGGQ